MDIRGAIIILIIMGIGFLITMFFLFKYMFKLAKEKMYVSSFFYLKSAKIKFKSFDSFLSHSLFVSPKRQYEVVYKLETQSGEIQFSLDNQIKITTDSRKQGSEVIIFSRFKPIISFKGIKAKNGLCSIKVYKLAKK